MAWNTNNCRSTTFCWVFVLATTVLLFQICDSQRTKDAVTKAPKTSTKKIGSTTTSTTTTPESTIASSTTDDSMSCVNDSDGSCTSSVIDGVEQLNNSTANALGTSTLLTTTTTEAPLNNESWLLPKSEVLKHIQMESYTKSDEDFCVCNLQLNYCDLNCCCDKDCSYRDKLVFDRCRPESRHIDSRYCDYVDYIYVNNTPHEWHVNQNGLFCVIRSNLPPTYTVQRKEPIASIDEAETQKNRRHSWPQPQKQEVMLNNSQTYRYGSPLWIIKNFTDLQQFYIPNNFVTHVCILNEDVKYLVDIKTSCSIHEITANWARASAETYFKNMTVVSSPMKINKTMATTNDFTGCPKNVCVPLEPYLCESNSECIKLVLNVSSNSTKRKIPKAECFFGISSRTYSCRKLVRSVKYQIFHDGIGGVKSAKVFLTLSNLTLHLGDYSDFQQDFQVDFLWWTNGTSSPGFGKENSVNFTRLLSGNPGYITGKPILIAKLISGWHFLSDNNNNNNNNKSAANSSRTPDVSNATARSYYMQPKVYRNPRSFPSNFMVLPRNVMGVCRLTQTEYYPVEFGFNLFTKCRMKEVFTNVNKPNNSNPSDMCRQIQKRIFHEYWSLQLTNDTLANKLIGQFGNADAHNKNHWIPVLFKRDLQEVLNHTWGRFTNGNRTVKCGNITTLLMVDIFHSRIDFEHLLNQEKILGTTITFGDFVELSFDYNRSSPDFQMSTRLSGQVTFFDVTSTKVKKFVDPPTFSVRLPYDFFYPFIRINNEGVCLFPTIYGMFLGVLSATITI